MKLTSEYKRITEQFKDLQTKFKHFEQSDCKMCVPYCLQLSKIAQLDTAAANVAYRHANAMPKSLDSFSACLKC